VESAFEFLIESAHTSGGLVTFTGRSVLSIALQEPLPFPPPLMESAQDKRGFELHWKLISYVFQLPQPLAFPPFESGTLRSEDAPAIRRFIETSRDLAASSFISSRRSVKFTQDAQSDVVMTVDNRLSKDVVVGFSTLFRQLYSGHDPGSFKHVHGIASNGQLRAYSIDDLALRKLADSNQALPPTPKDLSPEQLLSLYWSGDLIHWGRERDELAALLSDPHIRELRDAEFAKSITGLAHLYFGFAELLAAAFRNDKRVQGS
jgi:hypothetical protein